VHLYNTKHSTFDKTNKKTKNLTGKNFLHCPNIQTISETQPTSHSMGTWGFFPEGQSSWIMKPTTLHLVLRLRMSVAIPCSPVCHYGMHGATSLFKRMAVLCRPTGICF